MKVPAEGTAHGPHVPKPQGLQERKARQRPRRHGRQFAHHSARLKPTRPPKAVLHPHCQSMREHPRPVSAAATFADRRQRPSLQQQCQPEPQCAQAPKAASHRFGKALLLRGIERNLTKAPGYLFEHGCRPLVCPPGARGGGWTAVRKQIVNARRVLTRCRPWHGPTRCTQHASQLVRRSPALGQGRQLRQRSRLAATKALSLSSG